MIRPCVLLAIFILTGCTLAQQGAFDLSQYGKTATAASIAPSGSDDTQALQAALNLGGDVALEEGAFQVSSTLFVTVSGTSLRGVSSGTPAFGVIQSAGTRIIYSGTGPAVLVYSQLQPQNAGIAVSMSDLSLIGGGVSIVGDGVGEDNFVQGSRFRNVTVRQANTHGWEISGTAFLNTFDGCSSTYSAGDGLRVNPLSGSPINNNFINCLFSDAGGWSVNLLPGNHKELFAGCSISQGALGGLQQNAGYVSLTDCDFEANFGPALSLLNSSSATRVAGGTIHKTPATDSRVGIQVGALTANVIIDGVLFCNYDHPNDRLAAFSGGTLGLFDYRTQNCATTSFPAALWSNVARMPQFDWYQP